MTDDKTCAELVNDRCASRIEDLLPDFDEMSISRCRDLANEYSSDNREPDSTCADELGHWQDVAREVHQDHAGEMVLSIEKLTMIKVLLSTGGPGDWFELFHDGEDWVKGTYHYQDWYDHASVYIELDDVRGLADLWGLYPDSE